MTHTEQANNAIKWIDNLHKYKQAPFGNRGELGNTDTGFCCLGASCEILQIPYRAHDGTSSALKAAVGLINYNGHFGDPRAYSKKYYNKTSLATVNDDTHAGFKRIARLLRTKPEWVFISEVAKLIAKHYSNLKEK